MDWIPWAVNVLLLLGGGLLIWRLRRGGGDLSDLRRELEGVREQNRAAFEHTAQLLSSELRSSREEMGKTAGLLREEVDRKLGETATKNLEGYSVVADRIGKLQEATGQLVELSQGVRDLNVLLKTPGGRGHFGEMTLEQLLGDLFGSHTEMYETQQALGDGERVDAVIYVKPDRSLCLCVDAKFPMGNAQPILEGRATPEEEKAFARDVRARAEEIRSKYIRPPKTLDFALMFVPSEAVYYLILKDAVLHQELLRKKVVPSSPNSFYAYLHALSAAFRGMKIEQKTVELQKAILTLGKDFDTFAEWFRKLGEHLRRARTSFDETENRLDRFRGKIDAIREGEIPAEDRSAKKTVQSAAEADDRGVPDEGGTK